MSSMKKVDKMIMEWRLSATSEKMVRKGLSEHVRPEKTGREGREPVSANALRWEHVGQI